MKYSKFGRATELTEIGTYPQCSFADGYNPTSDDGLWNIKSFEFPDFLPNIELKLSKEAKCTDILSAGEIGNGFILNDRVKAILENHNLTAKAFYLIQINSKRNCKQYYLFHYITFNFWDWINKDKSQLFLRHLLPSKRSEILDKADLYLSPEDLMELYKNKPKLTNYYWEKLVFNESFPSLDFLETPFPSMNTIISERLLEAFKKAGITGYQTKEFCEVSLAADV